MALRKMQDPVDDIASQARQGSVAAIIQTLNEQLADAGVRTRAIFADGVLQLLCEAASSKQLEQSVLVSQVRQILEDIAPRNIRRVRINSRIVREQQLLWLEEITRDPKNLLWSEEIVLAKPNLLKQLTQSLKHHQTIPSKKSVFPKTSSQLLREQRPFRRGIVRGVGLSLALVLVSWVVYDWLNLKLNDKKQPQSMNSIAESSQTPSTASTSASAPVADPFVQAVRLAEQAAAASQTVQTAAQWLDVAAKWERASDLMSAVKPDDSRYKTARDRMMLYRQNSEVAQKKAKQKQTK